MDVTEVPSPASPGRHRVRRRGPVRTLLASFGARAAPRHDSWYGALWTIVVALDFLWLSNPIVLVPFDQAVHSAWVTTLIAALATPHRFRSPRPPGAVLAILGFGFASTLWSTGLSLTVNFAYTYLIIALVAMVIAANVGARTLAHGMILGGTLVLSLSVYALHANLPRAAIPPGGVGYLAGIGGNRNTLGYTTLLALTFAIGVLPRRKWGRAVWAAGTVFVGVGVFIAQSVTCFIAAMAVCAAAVGLGVHDRRSRYRAAARAPRRRWGFGALLLVGLVASAVGAEALGRFLGRDATTLSGRVPLWEDIWRSTTGVDLWFGSGWGAVWPRSWLSGPRSPAYLEIIDRLGFVLYHGHNSFFDLLPEVGLIGIALFAGAYAQAVRRALMVRDPRRAGDRMSLEAGRMSLLGVTALLLVGLTEPMASIPLGWFVIVVLATGLQPGESTALRD